MMSIWAALILVLCAGVFGYNIGRDDERERKTSDPRE